MTEHLPECWATYPSDPPAWCICDDLRACEARIIDKAFAVVLELTRKPGAHGEHYLSAINHLRSSS